MIKKLQHTERAIAKKIRAVFQASYQVEAALLKATDFPPLKRPLEKYIKATTQFFGYLKNDEITGVVEINQNNSFTLIRSLVVDPRHFRQGIGKKLMEFVLAHFESNLLVVETGVDNGPAIALYKKFGFIEVEQWDTDHGVRKVKFHLMRKVK